MSTKKASVQIFIAYSQKDRIFLDALRSHATPLLRKGNVTVWFDGEILPSEQWNDVIKKNLHAADIILMLLSANALASDYFYEQEVKDAVERHMAGTARVVPVVLSACQWKKTPLAEIQGLPRGMKPIVSYGNMDDAWNEVVEGLWEMVEAIENKETSEHQVAPKSTTLQQNIPINKHPHTIKESDKIAWKFVDKRSQKALLMFIKDFPNSNYIEEAQDVLSNIINDTTAWKYVYQRGTEEAYKEYLEDFPNGLYIEEALKQIKGYERIHKQEEQKKIEDHLKREKERRRIDPFYELMVPVKGGTFEMGDVFGEGQEREKPVHKVTLDDFMMCKYPVTQGLWKAVMGSDNNPSHFKGDDMLPVENVSWDMAQEFMEVLNKKSGASYRLPTEAEWEYAAREGGKKVRFGNGKDIADPAEMNFNASENLKQPYSVTGTYREKTSPVNLFKPNALGLYDMSGNVWEWCADYYADDYYQQCQKMGTVRNPKGPETGPLRVDRGGSWVDHAQRCRTTDRSSSTQAPRPNDIGFRLVLSALPV